MMTKDWAQAAANDIVEQVEIYNPIVSDIKATIVEHCPFKPDVVYMPVPRCDGCKHWDKDTMLDAPFGECLLLRHGNYARDLGISRLAIADFQVDAEPNFITQASFGCVQWEAK